MKEEMSKFIRNNLYSDKGKNLFFLTEHFCNEKSSVEMAKDSTRRVMARVLRNLQGKYWYKHPAKSVYVIEHGKNHLYHTHCIINIGDKTKYEFENAFKTVSEQCKCCNLCYDFVDSNDKITNFNPRKNHIQIKEVWNLDGVTDYILKEYNWNSNQINFDNFYNERTMFYC